MRDGTGCSSGSQKGIINMFLLGLCPEASGSLVLSVFLAQGGVINGLV